MSEYLYVLWGTNKPDIVTFEVYWRKRVFLVVTTDADVSIERYDSWQVGSYDFSSLLSYLISIMPHWKHEKFGQMCVIYWEPSLLKSFMFTSKKLNKVVYCVIKGIRIWFNFHLYLEIKCYTQPFITQVLAITIITNVSSNNLYEFSFENPQETNDK